MLQTLDLRYFRGELRQWVSFFEVVAMQRGDTAPAGPLDQSEVRTALMRQGWVQ
jgi:hypothetical protein